MNEKSGGFSLTPREGTYLVGLSNFLSSLMSTYTVKKIGRKTLLVWGHIAIAVIHAAVGLADMYDKDNVVLAMIMCFFLVYMNTSGPVAWLYAAETTIDTALGVCLLTLWGTVFVLSIICPVLMSPDSIGASMVFFIFSGLSVFGAMYSFALIKETKGLAEKDKKLLFTPRKYL